MIINIPKLFYSTNNNVNQRAIAKNSIYKNYTFLDIFYLIYYLSKYKLYIQTTSLQIFYKLIYLYYFGLIY